MLPLSLLPLALAAEPTFTWEPAVDLPITLGAAGVWAMAYTHVVHDLHPQDDASTPWGLDALVQPRVNPGAALASDVLLYGGIGVGLLGATAQGLRVGEGGAGARTRAALMVETFAVNQLATEWLKVAYDRPRPFTALDPQALSAADRAVWAEWMDEGDAWKSFPSGHASTVASTSFAWARMAQLSGASRGQAALAYGAAGLATGATATLRVAAGKHHPSDVIAGASLGAAVGWLVPTLHVAGRGLSLGVSGDSVQVQGRF